ncbi:MAG: RDD family protein [Siphonobacter sp.]
MAIHIQTTQNVPLEYLPASIGDRILAFLLDALILIAWIVMGSLVFGQIVTNYLTDEYTVVAYIGIIALPVMFYSLLSEVVMNGQSVGKRVMGLRVVRIDGTPAHLGDYLMRWLLRLLDIWALSGTVGLICMAIYPGQRLGDRAARTAVVKLRPPVRLEQVVSSAEQAPDYTITFSEAILLSDQDANTIRKVMKKTMEHHTFNLLEMTAQQVKQVTGIQTDLEDWAFLRTILQDHTYLTEN